MAFNKTWDVDKYKSEYESEEHWELRKRFMETHKDKFPEDKLVCLARVFFNVEFLGCRYPEKTMQLVAELSKGVADEFREKQKGKLKRTFVQASDAAGAKIKGAPSSVESPNKIPKASEGKPASLYACFVNAAEPPKPQITVESGEFPGFILYENCTATGRMETCPMNIITQSVQKNKQWNTIKFETRQGFCEIKINNKVLSSAQGETIKEAKMNAASEGLKKLRKTCYTIQAKCAFFSDNPLIDKSVAATKKTESPLPRDNIGSKMMEKMGWTGSGLGKQQQGIQAPIQATSQIVQRAGLGCTNEKQFHGRFRQMFKDYIASSSEADLVFTPDFTSDERKILHRLAQNLQLKTRSYGKDKDRHLVVFKQMTLPVLLDTLLTCGGENDKYLLIPPLGEDNT